MEKLYEWMYVISPHFLFLEKYFGWGIFIIGLLFLTLFIYGLHVALFKLATQSQYFGFKPSIVSTLFTLLSLASTICLIYILPMNYEVIGKIYEKVFTFFVFYFQSGWALFIITTLLLLLPNFLFFWIFFRFLQRKKIISPETEAWLSSVVVSLFISVLSPILVTGILFLVLAVMDNCDYGASTRFHEFNAHLKDVCDERKNKSECPKTEEELRQFNPIEYDQITACSKTFYTFDSATQEHTWMVKVSDGVYISHSHFYPGYGFYYLKGPVSVGSDIKDDQYYPPKFAGPWDKLPK